MSDQVQADPWLLPRQAMVATQLRHRGIRDPRVLAAMERVPRHLFVPLDKLRSAYDDQPIVIEAEQTISQPYIVAAMLEALALEPRDSVLEIGTGSGYQTALLAELTERVYSVERYEILAQSASERLRTLGYSNAEISVGDGTLGLVEHAPYNAIIVSAAAPRVPQPLLDQLADGGRLILPVGGADNQQLELVRKQGAEIRTTVLDSCRFVPLIGQEGFHV